MKVLSLTQPWASLVALEEKRIETRGWRTSYRGPLLIHAAKGFPRDCRELCDEEPFRSVLQKHGLTAATLPLGSILCETELLDDIETVKVAEAPCLYSEAVNEIEFGDYSEGRRAFLLGQVARVFAPPIPAKGALGLWEFPDAEIARRFL